MPENKKKQRQENLNPATVTLTTLAILIAAEIVLNLLEIHTGTIRINFGFLPVVVASYLFGAAGGITVYGLGDIVGCIVHPVGNWYPPITITYALMGAIFGLLLRQNRKFFPIVTSVVINQFIVSLFIMTLWISLLSFNINVNPRFFEFYLTTVGLRLIQTGIMTAAQIILIPPTLKAIDRIPVLKKLPTMPLLSQKQKQIKTN